MEQTVKKVIDWLKRELRQKQDWLDHGHYDTQTQAYVLWKVDFIVDVLRKLEDLYSELQAKLDWSKDDDSYETGVLKDLIREVMGVVTT